VKTKREIKNSSAIKKLREEVDKLGGGSSAIGFITEEYKDEEEDILTEIRCRKDKKNANDVKRR
jgi:hypothetical protein